MLTIGCHLSSSKGYLAMGKEALELVDGRYVLRSRIALKTAEAGNGRPMICMEMKERKCCF